MARLAEICSECFGMTVLKTIPSLEFWSPLEKAFSSVICPVTCDPLVNTSFLPSVMSWVTSTSTRSPNFECSESRLVDSSPTIHVPLGKSAELFAVFAGVLDGTEPFDALPGTDCAPAAIAHANAGMMATTLSRSIFELLNGHLPPRLYIQR